MAVPRTSRKPVLVIGDLIVDVHHYAANGGVSIEGGVPLGIAQEDVLTWGGAGLVVRNLLSLGMRVVFLSRVGDDQQGQEANRFNDRKLVKVFFTEPGHSTILKERFLIDGEKVLCVNRGSSHPISEKMEQNIRVWLKKNFSFFEKIIVADYRHGFMTETLARSVLRDARANAVPVYVDSQVSQEEANHRWYQGADLFSLNQREAASVCPEFDEDDLKASLEHLRKVLQSEDIVVKRAEKGSASLISGKYLLHHGERVEAIDPVGAGDAFMAALAACRDLSSASLQFANRWAAFSVCMQGTEPPTQKMFRAFCRETASKNKPQHSA